jgi:hippurate hydrolase
MAGEDFSEYGRAGVPAVIFWVGGADGGGPDSRPSLHSPLFAPPIEPTLRTAVLAETAVLVELLGGAGSEPN